MAVLFQFFHQDVPNKGRLAHYLPAALYPDRIQDFIEAVLPREEGSVWEIVYCGSGAGDETSPCDYNIPDTDELIRRTDQSHNRKNVSVHGAKKKLAESGRLERE